MNKAFLTIILSCICIVGYAQNKGFEYVDTSLVKQAESASDTTVTYSSGADNNNEENKNNDNTGKILSDTALYITKIDIAADSVRQWKKDKRFAYMRNLDSLLKKKQQENKAVNNDSHLKEDHSASFLERILSSGIIRIIFWAIAISFVGFILFKLFLSNGVFKKSVSTSQIEELPEEVMPVTVHDYDKLIHQSCKLGDYRMAVRYLFLKTLAQLSDKEYLQLSADKTNYQYVQEISPNKKNEFASLVLTYEYCWYGHFLLDQETYSGIEKKYIAFYHKI